MKPRFYFQNTFHDIRFLQVLLFTLVREFRKEPVELVHHLRVPHVLSKFVLDGDHNMARKKRLPQRQARVPGLPLLGLLLFLTLIVHSRWNV